MSRIHLRFILSVCIFIGMRAFSQNCKNSLDSLNKLLQEGKTVNLSRLGSSHIHLKDRTVLLNCEIIEVKTGWILYQKRKTLHDLAAEKVQMIEFENNDIILIFDPLKHGKISYK